jgi:hypothetical protein
MNPTPPEPLEDAQSDWDAEIARRIQELDSGTAKTLSWAEARRMILGENDKAPYSC